MSVGCVCVGSVVGQVWDVVVDFICPNFLGSLCGGGKIRSLPRFILNHGGAMVVLS